jgi:hypothetical protein
MSEDKPKTPDRMPALITGYYRDKIKKSAKVIVVGSEGYEKDLEKICEYLKNENADNSRGEE